MLGRPSLVWLATVGGFCAGFYWRIAVVLSSGDGEIAVVTGISTVNRLPAPSALLPVKKLMTGEPRR